MIEEIEEKEVVLEALQEVTLQVQIQNLMEEMMGMQIRDGGGSLKREWMKWRRRWQEGIRNGREG